MPFIQVPQATAVYVPLAGSESVVGVDELESTMAVPTYWVPAGAADGHDGVVAARAAVCVANAATIANTLSAASANNRFFIVDPLICRRTQLDARQVAGAGGPFRADSGLLPRRRQRPAAFVSYGTGDPNTPA